MAKKYWLKFGSGDPASTSGLAPTFIHFIKFDGTTLTPPGITQPITGVGMYQFTYTPSFSIAFAIDGATTGLSSSNRYIFGNLDPNDRLDEIIGEQGSTLSAIGTTLIAQGATVSGIAATLVAQGATVVAIGNTLTAQGTNISAIGTTLIAQGSTLVGMGTTFLAFGSTMLGVAATLVAQGATVVAIGNTVAAIGSSAGALAAIIGTTASVIGDSATSPGDLFGYLKRVREFLEGTQNYVKSSQAWSIYDRSGATLLASKTMTNNSTQVIRS